MNKIKQTTTLFMLLALLLVGKSWGQGNNGQPAPLVYQTINAGNQSLISQTITASEKWFKWTNDSINFSIDMPVTTKGLAYSLSVAELYKDNAGALVFLRRDTIKNNRLFLFGKNVTSNSSIYVKITTLSTGCGTCTPANPIITLNTLNLTPGCTGYIQPSCELIKDGGFESFSEPCAALGITSTFLGIPYPACYWQQPCNGSPDYFTSCSNIINSYNTNSNYNWFNNYTYLTPHNGDGYSGIYAYSQSYTPLSGWSFNYREYVTQSLTSPLVIGNNYTLKMWVRLATISTNTTDELHAILTVGGGPYACTPGFPFANNQQLISLKNATSSQINNTTGWALLTATFTAAYACTDITIGNYETDLVSNFSPAWASQVLGNAYYFIDDISLRPTSSFSVASQNISLCYGSSQTLTLSSVPNLGSGTYTWTSSPSTSSLSTQHIATVAVTPSVTTSYSIVVAPGGCGNSAVANINIYSPNPAPFLTASTYSACPLQTFEIGWNVGDLPIPQFTYTLLPNNITNSLTPYFGNLTTYTTGINTYTVLTSNGTGCVGKQIITIYSPSTITTNVTNTTICAGQSVLLVASGASSYTWNTGAITNSLLVSPSSTTIYTVSSINFCNQISSKTVTVTVKPLPTINVTNTLSSICAAATTNSLTTLTAVVSPTNATITWVEMAGTLTIPATQYTITGNTIQYNLSSYITSTVPINFCATASSGGCSTTTCTTIYPCCPTNSNITKFTNTTFSVAPSFTTTNLAFGGTITVNSGVTFGFQNANVFIDPNTKFIFNGNSLLNIRYSYLHGCYAMWDGIYANGTSNMVINNCVISDAVSAVNDAAGGASINLTNNYFNKNQQSVYFGAVKTNTSNVTLTNNLFTCSTLTLNTSSPWFTTVPNLTNAPTFSNIAITTMLPPYLGKNSFVGIYALNAGKTGTSNNAITIGGATNGTENIFDKLRIGVISEVSQVNLQNNVFQNSKTSINNSYTNYYNFSTGALVRGYMYTLSPPLFTAIGGTSTATKNTFINNDYGLYSYGNSTVTCSYNTFDNQDNGAFVTNNVGSLVNVSNNNFTKCLIGVRYLNNGWIDATIKDNNIDNSGLTIGTYSTNYAIRTEEATLATNASNYPKYTINNNNIKNYYNGIWSAQTLSTSITDNEVHMVQDNASDHWQRGIRVENSNTPKVNNNIVDMGTSGLNQWAYWQLGADMANNQVPRVQCNSVTNVNMGLAFGGNNLTAPGDGIIGNYMQNNGYGMWLVNNGEIGNQYKTIGHTTYSADNAWAGFCGACLYTVAQGTSNVAGGGSTMFTQSVTPYTLPFSKTNIMSASNYLSGTNNSAANTGTCNANTITPSNLKLGANAFDKLAQMGEDVADDYNTQGPNLGHSDNDNLTAPDGTDNISKRAINHYQLYRNVKLQGIDATGSPALQGFMNTAKNNNVGLLFNVDSLIHSAETNTLNITVAKMANNAINPSNKVEHTHKGFNTLYLSYLAQQNNLTANEISKLESIAQLCPMYYGNSVYQARTLLFGMKRQSYLSDCEKVIPLASGKKIAHSNAITNEVLVYPNPATNELFVMAEGYADVQLKLYNTLGELVIEKMVTANQSMSLVSLTNGIYTYKIYHNNNELKTDKLIIIK